MSDAVGDFGIRLLKTAADEQKGNLIFSAHNIYIALGMILFGADGS